MAEAKEKRDRSQMRSGYTTGANATAAATAAARALVTGEMQSEVTIWIPAGKHVTFQLHSCQIGEGWARCSTIKDGGDDPDVTHGAEIAATVSWRDRPGLELAGGVGVGTVTKPGLGLEVGGPAINPVPRRMITEHVTEVLGDYLPTRGARVEISVPRGEELAKKTLNARLGIIGGISILGTTGIVVPYSTSAFRASIAQGMDVALVQGCTHLVVTTGGRSEKHAMRIYPELPEVAFVEMGEFLGFSLRAAAQRPAIRKLTVAGMIGKLAKVAQGHVNLHARHSTMDAGYLAAVAAQCGASAGLQEQIRGANTARHVQEMVTAAGLEGYFDRLCALSCHHCREYAKAPYAIEVIMTDFDTPTILGRAEIGPYPLAGGEQPPQPEEDDED